MYCVPVCQYVHHMLMGIHAHQQRAWNSLNWSFRQLRATRCGYWEMNPGLLREQEMLLIIKPAFDFSMVSMNNIFGEDESGRQDRSWRDSASETLVVSFCSKS